MTEDASAGRLYADVVADTSGFRKDAEAKLKKAAANLKASARAEVTFSRTQARAALNAALREAAKDTKLSAVTAKVGFDPKQVRRELQRALREAAKAEKPPTVTVKVEVDDANARRQLDRLGRTKRVVVDTRANTKGAEDDIENSRRRIGQKPIDLNVRIPTAALSRVGSALSALSGFPAIASGIMVAAGAVANLTGGLFAMAASASQAVGVLAAIPNAIGVAAQGVGALLLGLSGISDAVKAMDKAQQQAGTTAQKSGAAQVAAAQAVKDAQEQVARAQEAAAERVAEAQRRVSDAQQQAMERVRAARENLSRTQEAAAERAAEAEQAVARAQEQAAERVIEAQRRIAEAQEAAAERVAEAQRRLADAQQQAIERVQEARENLSRVQEEAAERAAVAEQRVSDAQAAGAARIVDAQRRVADAHRTVQQAVEGLREATEQATERAQDLALQLSGAALDEEGAQLALERAANRLRDIMSPASTASDLDKREADLAYRQALQRLAEIRESNEDLAAEKADLDQTGIQGSREVTDAQERLNEAIQAEADARAEVGQVTADAAREVAEAQQELAKVQRDSARDIADAQADVLSAQAEGARQVADAQQDLTKAQAEGVRDIAEAQQDLAEAQRDGARDIAEAQQNLVKTQRDNARDIADAQRDIAEAQADGTRAVSDAQRDLVKAQRDSARQVADAQQDLARAMAQGAASAETTTAAMTSLSVAMDNLSPAGQKFANFINNTLKPRFKELRFAVQEALLPPLQEAITKALPLLDVIEKGLVGTGKVLGDMALDLADVFASPAFKRDVGDIMASNNRAMADFGKALVPLVKILARVAVVAGPTLLEPFAKWTAQTLKAAEASDKLSKSSIRDFLERAAATAKTLASIVGDVVIAIYNLGGAARPTGDTLLNQLADAAERLRKWTEDPANQQRIHDFFANTVPLMEKAGAFLNRVVSLFFRLGEITGGGTLDGLFWVLDKILDVLEGIANLPGGGAILTAILTLSGVGLGLGLVAKAIGGIVTNIARLAKYTGVTKLFDKLRGIGKDTGKTTGTGKGPLGKLADEADDLGDAIDRELPKDKKKSDAVKDIGDKSDVTKTKAKDLGKGVDDLGKQAEVNAKKSGKLSRAITTIGKKADTAKGKIGTLFSSIGEKTKGKAGTIGKGAAGVGGIAALLFGDDIMEMLGIDPDSLGGGALQGAISGGGIGSFLGPIGTVLGSVFGAGFGTVGAGGGDIGKAAIGALGGLPGLLIGGFHDKIIDELTKLATDVQPQVQKIKGFFSNLPTEISGFFSATWERAKQTVPGLAGIGPAVSGVLNNVQTGFTTLRTKAPELLRGAWQTALATVPGLGPLATTVGGILNNAQTGFQTLRTKAPELLRNAWNTALDTVPGLRPLSTTVGTVLNNVQTGFQTVRTKAPELLRNAWTTITSGASSGLASAQLAIGDKLSQIGTAFTNIKNTITTRLSEAWTNVSSTASTWLTTIRTDISSRLTAIGGLFTSIKDDITSRIRETMSDIGSRFSSGLESVRTTASNILNKISGAFTTAKDSIGSIWAGVQEKAAVPVRWIGNNVYNRGIKAVWDKVAGLVNMSPLPAFSGFASGGIYPGYTPGRDIGLAAVSGGEAIMRPEWTKAVGSGFVNLMNRLARSGGVRAVRAAMGSFMGGYASGGVVGGVPFAGSFEDGGIIGWLSGLVATFTGKAKAGFADGLKAAADAVLGPLLDVVGQSIGGSGWGNLLARVPRMAVDAFIDFLVTAIEPKLGNKAVVEAAQRWIGHGDNTDGYSGANNNIFNAKWGFGAGTPWCANFVSTAVSDAGAGGKYPGYPTAAVYGYYSQMQKVGGDQARAGDLGVYDSPTGHINIIESNQGQGRFTTIGGNENSVVRRANRTGAYAILRPTFARGGIIDRRVFAERNEGYGHDKNDPLYRLLSRLSPSVAGRVSSALAQAEWMRRDSGGPLHPGLNVVANNTRGLEWVLTPEAVSMLGGPAAVQSLNEAARLHRSAGNATATGRVSADRRPTGGITQNIYPQPRQSEHEIAMIAQRKLGALLGR